MQSSAIRTFSDPGAYAAAIRAGTIETTVIGRGQFAAKLVRIDLHSLWLQHFSENLPRVLHSANGPKRGVISFRTEPGPPLFASGVELLPTTIMRHSEGENYHQRSSGIARFAAMSLAMEDWASIGAAAGCDLTPPREAVIVRPPAGAMARLQLLHAAAICLAEEAPHIIANADAAHGLEQQFIEALVGCLGEGETHKDSMAQRHHELIMRRFRRIVEESSGRPLYIPEVCRAIRVAERTLQVCCQEHLGMGPKRYLQHRRLQLAHQALRAAGPKATTVTEVATRYGFWQFGRFSVAYREQFGESPSDTLRRSTDQ